MTFKISLLMFSIAFHIRHKRTSFLLTSSHTGRETKSSEDKTKYVIVTAQRACAERVKSEVSDKVRTSHCSAIADRPFRRIPEDRLIEDRESRFRKIDLQETEKAVSMLK